MKIRANPRPQRIRFAYHFIQSPLLPISGDHKLALLMDVAQPTLCYDPHYTGEFTMKYRFVMTVAAVAVMLAGLAFGLYGPVLLGVFGIDQPPGFTPPHMSFYRMRSFLFVAGTILFGFGLVTLSARKVADPIVQRGIAIGHFFAYLAAGLMNLSQQTALWETPGGWISVAFFFILAVAMGYLGYVVLADAVLRHPPTSDGDTENLRERWKHEISAAAVQQERIRLARDLHDSIKQQIFTIGVSAAAAQARWESDPSGARTALEDVRGSAHEAMVEMEAMLQHLRPAPLETVGLAEALRKQCEALKYRTGAQVVVEFADLPENERLRPGTQESVFRITQEALANVARHARAANVQVRLCSDGKNESMILQVQDDGQGFTPSSAKEGMGMANIRARTREIGGQLNLWSEPGGGTKLDVRIPLAKTAEHEAERHFSIGALNVLAVVLIMGWFLQFGFRNTTMLFGILFALPFNMIAISRFVRMRRVLRAASINMNWLHIFSGAFRNRW